ncbi:uncharacterized protein N7459_000800 [Penicillium hispanicum]|uniref:uncharacterized protein n=1 Tax=Penicillium hispanicum TaxID=1080232 RepID=UPI00253FACF1|nr:uncharacterized protein N7459_000800 [Penicillium hispanicum]KAJ5594592.1 hypothetical protein N7459_000800 [Penicillium hispanicum]
MGRVDWGFFEEPFLEAEYRSSPDQAGEAAAGGYLLGRMAWSCPHREQCWVDTADKLDSQWRMQCRTCIPGVGGLDGSMAPRYLGSTRLHKSRAVADNGTGEPNTDSGVEAEVEVDESREMEREQIQEKAPNWQHHSARSDTGLLWRPNVWLRYGIGEILETSTSWELGGSRLGSCEASRGLNFDARSVVVNRHSNLRFGLPWRLLHFCWLGAGSVLVPVEHRVSWLEIGESPEVIQMSLQVFGVSGDMLPPKATFDQIAAKAAPGILVVIIVRGETGGLRSTGLMFRVSGSEDIPQLC